MMSILARLVVFGMVVQQIAFSQDVKYLQNETFTVEETYQQYRQLQEKFPDLVKVKWFPEGGAALLGSLPLASLSQSASEGEPALRRPPMSDAGVPLLHVVLGGLSSESLPTLLINNAIHPGEPCGVDASVKLAYDLMQDPVLKSLLQKVRIVIIPVYNIGGAMNRGQSRVNQPGPVEYGFRGNARNLDLNRDFIKCDSRNAMAFARIYHHYRPEVFIDAHTTNGYDYQYGMSLLATHPDKLHPDLAQYMTEQMLPFLYADMKTKNKEMTPYVFGDGELPEDGLKDYLETPRYSSGYTTLFHTIGFITEAHKYKSYPERVEYTYAFYRSVLDWMNAHGAEIAALKKEVEEKVKTQDVFPVAWAEDTTRNEMREFKGYEASYTKSEVTGQPTLSYDRSKPYTKQIPYRNHFVATSTVQRPEYYVVPQAWREVLERLRMNGIAMRRLTQDTLIDVEMYYIDNFQTVKSPYEGHYLHHSTSVRSAMQQIQFRKGDMLIPVNQSGNRYIVETLEPTAVDSYFNWNFFDAILQQKEWFSTFTFEPTAATLLKENAALRNAFEQKKKDDPAFATDHFAQLYFIYQRSPYFEPSYRRYPVGRILQK